MKKRKMMKKMTKRQRIDLKMGFISFFGQIGVIFYFILAIIAGIIFYPYILWCDLTSSPHYEESGYDA